MKSREKIDKSLDFTSELRKFWNVRIIVIPVIVGVLGTVSKCLDNTL